MKVLQFSIKEVIAIVLLLLYLLSSMIYGIYIDHEKAVLFGTVKVIFILLLFFRMRKSRVAFIFFLLIVFIYLVQEIIVVFKYKTVLPFILFGILVNIVTIKTFLFNKSIRDKYWLKNL